MIWKIEFYYPKCFYKKNSKDANQRNSFSKKTNDRGAK